MINRVAVNDPIRAATMNDLIDTANTSLLLRGKGLGTVLSSGKLIGQDHFAIHDDSDAEAVFEFGDIVTITGIEYAPNYSDTNQSIALKVSTYRTDDDPLPRPVLAVVVNGISADIPGSVIVGGLAYVVAERDEDLEEEQRIVGVRMQDDDVRGILVPYFAHFPVLGVAEDPTEEGGEKYLALVQVVQGLLPMLGQTTADVVDERITGKLQKQDGTLVGDDMTYDAFMGA